MYGIAAAPSAQATCMQEHAYDSPCCVCAVAPSANQLLELLRLAPGCAGAFTGEAALQGTHHSQTQKVHHKMHGSTATSCLLETFQHASQMHSAITHG
jgi:hypothetical protein